MACLPLWVELHRAGRQQQHHSGAEQEPTHFFSLGEANAAFLVIPLAQGAGAWWIDLAMPGGSHAAHNGRAHQHHDKRPVGTLKHAHHPLVARKQPGHPACCGGVDGEQRARHMHHAQQAPGARHVNAVVVAWAEVDGGKVTVLELCSQLGVPPEQGLGTVVVALGLEYLPIFNRPELADGAIHRANPWRFGQRTGALAQGAGEEIVEAGIGRRVGFGGFAHVNAVALNETLDENGSPCPSVQPGHAAHEVGQGLFGQEVLRKNSEAIRHRRQSRKEGLAGR